MILEADTFFHNSISKPVDSVVPGRRRYPLTLEAIGQILEAFNIPLPFINIMAAHATVAMDYDAVQDFQLPATAPSKRTGIIFVLGPIALATSYSIVTKMTTGVVLGLCNHQTSRLISLVENIAEVSQVPTMLPLILVNVLSETRAHRVLGRKQAINRLEVDLGVHWSVQVDLRPKDRSLEVATRQLTVYGSEVAWDLHAIEAQLEMITLVAGVQDSINEQDNTVDEQSPAMVAFQARARRARQTLSGLIHWTHYNQQRIQIQLQTVGCTLVTTWCPRTDPHPDLQSHLTARQRPQLPDGCSLAKDRRSNTARRRAHETARRPVQSISTAHVA